MRIPKTSIRTTWRANWLAEFSIALVVLAFLTREVIFAAVGAGILSTLASLGLVFHRKVDILRREIHVTQRLSKTRVFLGESVEGELTIRNGSRLVVQILTVQPVLEKTLSFRLSSSFNQLLRPGTASSLKFAIATLASGRFQISRFALTFTDARGLFASEVEYAQPGSVVEVHPGVRTQTPLTPLRLYGGGPEVFRKASAGTDYAGIHEYAPGDEYRRVEWKATARLRTLMVKEFHPETQITLQILIDAGKTMRQQSYMGSRLDEAFAVAQLLIESAILSENRVGILVYDETRIMEVINPATAENQLVWLRKLAVGLHANIEPNVGISSIPMPRPKTRALLRAERMAGFMRSLRLRKAIDYSKTGVYKAFQEATQTHLQGVFIILTDLQRDSDVISEALSNGRRHNRVLIVQIGAGWRLSNSLEGAYLDYQRNSRALQHLERSGAIVVDGRPETFLETIDQHIRRKT